MVRMETREKEREREGGGGVGSIDVYVSGWRVALTLLLDINLSHDKTGTVPPVVPNNTSTKRLNTLMTVLQSEDFT